MIHLPSLANVHPGFWQADSNLSRAVGPNGIVGQWHLGGQNLEQIIVVPTSFQAFGLDASFECCFLSEQIQGDMTEDGKVLSGLALAHATIVFAEDDIQDPVHLVFDSPVGTYGFEQLLRNGNKITCPYHLTNRSIMGYHPGVRRTFTRQEVPMQTYAPEIEKAMRNLYESLNEKSRRRYAGLEALKLGHGGRSYIANVLGCSRRTVSRGANEVSQLPKREVECRIRKPGGGRKSYEEKWSQIDEKFLLVLRTHTAGDPMDEKVRWTNLTLAEIVKALREDHSMRVSKWVVRRLLKKHHYRRRKAQKKRTKQAVAHRNEQFENIARLIAEYEAAGNPVVSMDTKKKELLGNLYRDGHLYTLEELQTYDHDFKSYAEGIIIPHGLYDLRLNIGYLQLGNSCDTSEFACDSLRYWWYIYAQQHYPTATSILLLCDGGGSNSSRHFIFKADLQDLADEIGVEIRIAHYPPYCSKYNPIEHRFFPHVTRACQGVIFTSVELVKQLMEKTHTKTGLQTFVHIIHKVYHTGRKVAADFKETMRIVFDDFLPRWNYRAIPLSQAHEKVI